MLDDGVDILGVTPGTVEVGAGLCPGTKICLGECGCVVGVGGDTTGLGCGVGGRVAARGAVTRDSGGDNLGLGTGTGATERDGMTERGGETLGLYAGLEAALIE